MDKKKAVKLATASAVAASAFVAANPHASQAATDVATVVSQAKAQMKEAYYTYSHTVTETGKLPNISDVYAAYNKAKQAYANAVAVVNKAGGAKKDAYLADLQATYETYVFKANPKSGEARVATYIDAYNYATKLDAMRQELKAAVDAKDLKKAGELYHKISYELKTRTVILDRVYGQTTRELLRSQFKAEAQKLRDSLVYDITVSMKAREAQDAVKAGNLDKAKAALDQVNQYVSKVTDAFKAELQKAAQDANAAYEAALTPKVESVSAINLKSAVIKFNKEVDEKTVTTSTIKVYKNNSTSAETVTVTLSEDKKSAVVVFNTTLQQSDSLKFVVEGVKTTDGKDLAKYEQTVTVTDTTAPEVTDVKVLSSKSLKLTTTEPIDALNPDTGFAVRTEVKVDGVSVPVEVVRDASDNSVVLNFGQSLSVGEHKLAISGLKDYAGFKIADKEFSFTIAADTTAPTVTAAKVVDANTVEVTFSEPVSNIGTVTIAGTQFTQSDVGALGAKTVSANKDKTVYTFKNTGLISSLGLGALVEVQLKYQNVTDVEGNKNTTEQTFKFKAEDDTTVPTVTLNLKTDNTLEVLYSESVSNAGTITVKDSKGTVLVNKLALSTYYNSTDKKATVPASALQFDNKDAGSYTVVIEGVKDASIRANEAPAITSTVTIKDVKAPTAQTAVLSADGKTIDIYFSEAMDTATLSNKDNYVLGSGFLSSISGATLTVGTDAKSVKITLPTATSETNIKVLGLKDTAGNIVYNFNQPIPLTSVSSITFNQTSIDAATVKAVAPNKIELSLAAGYAYTFGNVDPSTFALYDAQSNTANAKYVATAYELSADKKKLTLTLNGNLYTNGTFDGASGTLYLATTNSLTTNSAGKALSIAKTAGLAVADAIKPTVSKVEAGDTLDGDTTVEANTFTVTFSEPIQTAGSGDAVDEANILNELAVRDASGKLLAASQLDIVDHDGTNIDGSKVLVIQIADGALDVGSNTITVGIPVPRVITDMASTPNLIEEVAPKSVTVSTVAAPVAPSSATLAVGTNAGTTKLTGVDNTMEYKVGAGSWTAITGTSVDNISVNKGDVIQVRVAAKDGVSAGAAKSITVDYANIKPAAAPTGIALAAATNTGTKLTGVAAGMEYRVNNGTWVAITGTTVDNIAAAAGDTIEVRVAQTATQPASQSYTHVLTAGEVK
ncbi:hypothetical protein [Geobacillus sp. Y412MC52]|uniref:hypothetical protein n=1 Tax=Geobacillus sp. (strain Y412MC52) TaxID=550542 RepID=UPI00018C1B54|nr:hypothetical protein [Geobacillus sp. Y412MC52]ADU95664.1 hypothetical protein GYMC52_3313 [Geobacillus sp. Y412MC52]